MLPVFRWQSIVDFLVLAAMLYAVLRWARSARALRIALGVVGLHALALLARHLDLVITSWVLDSLAILAVILLLLIFQPELRAAFMRLDSALRSWPRPWSVLSQGQRAIADAAFGLARENLGALLVVARRDAISELLNGGVVVGAEISSELLMAIFQKVSPLHDGAVIIDGDHIAKAGVVLPLTQRQDIAGYYGTRHRAGMGLAERCDALVIVVSEERAEVTLLLGRNIRRLDDPGSLVRALGQLLDNDRKRPTKRIYQSLIANIGLKLGALGLAGLIWAMSFLAAGTTIRTVTLPIEFENVPVGMEIAEQTADSLEVQFRGSPWVIDSIGIGRLVARFDLSHLNAGWNTLQLAPATLDLPPGIVVDRVTPAKIRVRITSTKSGRRFSAPGIVGNSRFSLSAVRDTIISRRPREVTSLSADANGPRYIAAALGNESDRDSLVHILGYVPKGRRAVAELHPGVDSDDHVKGNATRSFDDH